MGDIAVAWELGFAFVRSKGSSGEGNAVQFRGSAGTSARRVYVKGGGSNDVTLSELFVPGSAATGEDLFPVLNFSGELSNNWEQTGGAWLEVATNREVARLLLRPTNATGDPNRGAGRDTRDPYRMAVHGDSPDTIQKFIRVFESSVYDDEIDVRYVRLSLGDDWFRSDRGDRSDNPVFIGTYASFGGSAGNLVASSLPAGGSGGRRSMSLSSVRRDCAYIGFSDGPHAFSTSGVTDLTARTVKCRTSGLLHPTVSEMVVSASFSGASGSRFCTGMMLHGPDEASNDARTLYRVRAEFASALPMEFGMAIAPVTPANDAAGQDHVQFQTVRGGVAGLLVVDELLAVKPFGTISSVDYSGRGLTFVLSVIGSGSAARVVGHMSVQRLVGGFPGFVDRRIG